MPGALTLRIRAHGAVDASGLDAYEEDEDIEGAEWQQIEPESP